MSFIRVIWILYYLSAQFLSASSLKIETPHYSPDEYKAFMNTIWDVIKTLGVDTPDLSIKKSNFKSGIELQFTTENDFKYHFFPVSSTSIQFAVKASSDVYIAFSSKPFKTHPIELIIGQSNNTKTLLQQSHLYREEIQTPGILNNEEYRRFLVRWGDGVLLVWRTGEHRPFISWVLPLTVPITYIGVRTGAGVSGSWIIEDLSVENIQRGSRKDVNIVQFKVKTTNDAHIGLFNKPALFQGQMIEIVLGGARNTEALIRRGEFKFQDVIFMKLPGLLNASEYRGFWLHWGDVISVGREGEHCPFMTWPDPNPFQVTHLGIHTGYGASGTWKIEDWDEIPTPDSAEYNFQPFAALSALTDSTSAAFDSW